MNIALRFAAPSDAASLLEIYRPYVESTTVSLEYNVPTETEFAGRIREFSAEFPYIVCEIDGIIAGYAYAHRYKERFGYRFAAETTVYLCGKYRGMGLGKRLYGAIFELLTLMGFKNLYAIVTGENSASIDFHNSVGFTEIGREHKNGFKLGRWVDVVLFEKQIGECKNSDDTAEWQICPKSIHELGSRCDEILKKYEKWDEAKK